MPPTNALGNWYANLICIGRVQMVMATSERSLLRVLLPAVDLRTLLVPNLCEAVYELLQQIEVDPVRALRELEAMQLIRRLILHGAPHCYSRLSRYSYIRLE